MSDDTYKEIPPGLYNADEWLAAIEAENKLKEAIAAEWPDYIITVETRGADIAHPPVYAMKPTVDSQIADAFKPKI